MLPKWFCTVVYRVWPPVLRVLETVRFHRERQDFLIGVLRHGKTADDLRRFLGSHGYEKAILAWRDTGEVLGMRKIDKSVFQYHLRLFKDGEIRGHYEYSSEGSPLRHSLSTRFDPETDYFRNLLDGWL